LHPISSRPCRAYTRIIEIIRKITPTSVIRGVQLSTGALLISSGVKFMIGTSRYQELHQAVEPHLSVQSLGIIPISLVIGAVAAVITLFLLNSKKLPAGLIVVAGGLAAGLA
jgi:SulP family sulfate permease